MIGRRRFLGISATLGAVALIGALRQERFDWKGFGFGGEISIALHGDQKRAQSVIAAIQSKINALENNFSLFRENSEISRLNRERILAQPSGAMLEVLQISKSIWQDSNGRFDPTVQTIWRSETRGLAEKCAVNFGKVELGQPIRLHNQELTLNGIAQGYAADVIATELAQYGFEDILVNMGEYRAGARAWAMEVQNEEGLVLETISLKNASVATSSAYSDRFKGQSHIIDPFGGSPLWKTVSVISKEGAVADGWSTAMMLMPKAEIRNIDFAKWQIHRIIIEDFSGQVERFNALV